MVSVHGETEHDMRHNISTSRWLSTGFVVFLTLFDTRSTPALIVGVDDTATNTDIPADDPGWNNVGRYGSTSAVYLGNGWIMTADHVDLAESAQFAGQSYEIVPGSEISLLNPEGLGLTVETDLRLSQLELMPDLPPLLLSSTPPPIDSDVIMIGRGRDRELDQTLWSVAQFGDDFVWTEVAVPPADAVGFKWTSTQTKRWGTNVLIDDLLVDQREVDLDHDIILEIEGRNVVSLITVFDGEDAELVTEFEAHATLGDSGGGVFYKNDGQWELAGVMFAVSVADGQPDDTAVFGNATFFADMATYREQIEKVVFPQPDVMLQAGDADQNLSFDQFDLVAVLQAATYLSGAPATWGQGDWDAAPGGAVGNAPIGNGLFDQFDVIAALQNGLYLAGPYTAVASDGAAADGQTSIVYDAATGEISIDTPAGVELTSVNLESAASIFTAGPAENLGGSFDIDTDANVFKATFGSTFGSITFGKIAPEGLSEQFLLSDLSAVGSLAEGGDLGDVDLIYVPEPHSWALLVFGGLLVVSAILSRARMPAQALVPMESRSKVNTQNDYS